jgi:hypothetical protein
MAVFSHAATPTPATDESRFALRRICFWPGPTRTWRRFPFVSTAWVSSLPSTSAQFSGCVTVGSSGEAVEVSGRECAPGGAGVKDFPGPGRRLRAVWGERAGLGR